ncbi:coiled-coil domain-containing protein 137 isoform X1 [Syngnathus scovelli]|uniref:coiled-coil domain-containing protein 137 isoform X1 n=2 Tax=Syngnathus scovelli TaxID=161590 RepID=UPI0021107F2E|nr:coiled-coil domain-containing protein 137 isoform X1 [Syngnathus scovelli]
MGKRKKCNSNNCGEVADKTAKQASVKKRDVKAKRDANQGDHLEHIPFKLQEILKSKERMENSSLTAKKLRDVFVLHRKPEKSTVGDIAIPRFKRGKRESELQFNQRMEMESKHVLFLTNNQVERKPELNEDKQEKPANGGKSDKMKAYDKLKLQKRQRKTLERQEVRMEKEMFQDDIAFGEVSTEPPSLTSKPKKALIKPGAAKELLLNSLLGHTAMPTSESSMARQRMMEEERRRAVLAYRQLKKQRQQEASSRRPAPAVLPKGLGPDIVGGSWGKAAVAAQPGGKRRYHSRDRPAHLPPGFVPTQQPSRLTSLSKEATL